MLVVAVYWTLSSVFLTFAGSASCKVFHVIIENASGLAF